MTAPTVVGIDLSLTSTGIAVIHSDGSVALQRIQSKGTNADSLETRHLRLRGIAAQVVNTADDEQPDLVVIENPAYSRVGGSAHDRSGLWWMVTSKLIARGHQVVTVPPSCRPKYATGAGGGPNSGKDRVLAAVIRRYPQADVTGNDEADALILAAMGARHLGHPIDGHLPQTHLNAMNGAHLNPHAA